MRDNMKALGEEKRTSFVALEKSSYEKVVLGRDLKNEWGLGNGIGTRDAF
jgi:hypothetical protein